MCVKEDQDILTRYWLVPVNDIGIDAAERYNFRRSATCAPLVPSGRFNKQSMPPRASTEAWDDPWLGIIGFIICKCVDSPSVGQAI